MQLSRMPEWDVTSIASLKEWDEDELQDFEDFNHALRQTHNQIHQTLHMAHVASSDANGVAMFVADEDENEDKSNNVIYSNWEMLEGQDYYEHFENHGSTSLNKILDSAPLDSICDSTHFFVEDEATSTCSLSTNSMLSTSSTVTFVPSVTEDVSSSKKQLGSKNVKTKLQAIVSMIDPTLSDKIKSRRGVWGGCFDVKETSHEKDVEVEYGKESELHQGRRLWEM